jgi:hypothetical protein
MHDVLAVVLRPTIRANVVAPHAERDLVGPRMLGSPRTRSEVLDHGADLS